MFAFAWHRWWCKVSMAQDSGGHFEFKNGGITLQDPDCYHRGPTQMLYGDNQLAEKHDDPLCPRLIMTTLPGSYCRVKMKSGRAGAALWTSFSPHSAMLLAWATSGGSRTYVTATVEVSTTVLPFDISITLVGFTGHLEFRPLMLFHTLPGWYWLIDWSCDVYDVSHFELCGVEPISCSEV